MQARRLPKAFVSSAGILNLPITSLPVDNFKDRVLWCKTTGIDYNMHGWILCRYCATGWFWWISGLRAVTMWSSASFTKSKHIDWTLGLKCDHQVWPWPWASPWIFKVKYGICYISTKKSQITTKRKANISNEFQASNVTNGFDLGNDFDLWIFKVRCDQDLWPDTWCWLRIFMVKFWNSCTSEWEGRVKLNKGGGSRSFMTLTVTIWWPRSGERIYHRVTRVTSDVGEITFQKKIPSYFRVKKCILNWQQSAKWQLFCSGPSAFNLLWPNDTILNTVT